MSETTDDIREDAIELAATAAAEELCRRYCGPMFVERNAGGCMQHQRDGERAARALSEAGLLKGSPDDRAWVWMKQAERLKAERDELASRIEALSALHAPGEMPLQGGDTWTACTHCIEKWPCPTAALLDGTKKC